MTTPDASVFVAELTDEAISVAAGDELEHRVD